LQHWYQPELLIPGLLRSLESNDRLFVVLLTLGHSHSGNVGELVQRLSAHQRSLVVDEFLSREEINKLWSATDIIISVPHADGISESVLEAAYSGAFPILSDIPSNRSLVEDGFIATLVESDVSSIADALESAIARPRGQTDAIRAANESWILRNATIDQTATDLADRLRVLAASCRERRE
jgi:glycosyltransferase involved in cell wall biosynthesis